jgi:threonine dehydratase
VGYHDNERQSSPDQLITLEAIRAAAARISNIAVRTPLVRAQFPNLSGHGTNKEIYLKAESLQPIGAFKIRGASNKILQLTPEQISRGVITYSSGNHAQGVAYAAREGRRQSRHRHAFQRPRHQARRHARLGR